MEKYFKLIDVCRTLEKRAIDIIQARIDGLADAMERIAFRMRELEKRLEDYENRS